MHVLIFQTNIDLIKSFMNKLHRENVPPSMQKILLKIYAKDLHIHLTDTMIGELLH
ncbi:MAG: hypothetical protein N4A62_09855 [Marinisporobacter sp.]|jgi:hypothetical protein|nr:hypothetical protein [Marinisporobacter sp.]